jgi:inhibitor of KinA sporulation pathway (predicted exonuclease)
MWGTVRFATNKYRNISSVGNMLQHLEWRSLEDRRNDSRLNMFYKIVNNKVEIQKNRQTYSTKKADTTMASMSCCN